jgi:hypothetical protein
LFQDAQSPLLIAEKKQNISVTVYRESKYGFSFTVLGGYSATSSVDKAGTTVLIRDVKNTIVGQLYLSSAPDVAGLTPEFIHQNMQDAPIFDARAITLGSEMGPKTEAVAFSFDPVLKRKSSETWFVHNKVLYQWTIDAGVEEKMMTMIKSMQW